MTAAQTHHDTSMVNIHEARWRTDIAALSQEPRRQGQKKMIAGIMRDRISGSSYASLEENLTYFILVA